MTAVTITDLHAAKRVLEHQGPNPRLQRVADWLQAEIDGRVLGREALEEMAKTGCSYTDADRLVRLHRRA